jgi:hypothetical protein
MARDMSVHDSLRNEIVMRASGVLRSVKDVRIRESYCGCPEGGLWELVGNCPYTRKKV